MTDGADSKNACHRKCVPLHAIAWLFVFGLFAAFSIFGTHSIETPQLASKVTYITVATDVSGASSHDNDHGIDCDRVIHCHAPIALTAATKLAEPELTPVMYAPAFLAPARAMLSIASPPPKSS